MLLLHLRPWTRPAAAVALILGIASALGADSEEDAVIARVLGLRPGHTVADVGAGSGKYTVGLAREVGTTGRVYATEIEQRHLDSIRERMTTENVGNVTTVLGDQASIGLPDGCCDRVLLRLVYHHFSDPPTMRTALWRAMKPGALVAVVDVPPQKNWSPLSGVPDRGGHGIELTDLIREMKSSGFELVHEQHEWPGETDGYAAVFRRP
jgi:predicted methyltransferase